MILAIFLVTLMTSCEKTVSEADVNQAREKIAEIGRQIGISEANLQDESEPGKIALETEDLRDEKAKLERTITEFEKVIPRVEALEIARANQARSARNMLKSAADFKAESKARQDAIDEREAGFRREQEQRQRDRDLLKAMEDAQSGLEKAQYGLEMALIDSGNRKALEDAEAKHRKQHQESQIKIDAQRKKISPDGELAPEFKLPED